MQDCQYHIGLAVWEAPEHSLYLLAVLAAQAVAMAYKGIGVAEADSNRMVDMAWLLQSPLYALEPLVNLLKDSLMQALMLLG